MCPGQVPLSAGLGCPRPRRAPGSSHRSALSRSLGGVTAACEGVPGPGSSSQAAPAPGQSPLRGRGPSRCARSRLRLSRQWPSSLPQPRVRVRSARGKPGMLCDEERTEPGRRRVLDSVLGSSTWHRAPKDGSPALPLQRWPVNPSLYT